MKWMHELNSKIKAQRIKKTKMIPTRIRKGLVYFKNDFTYQLELFSDQHQRTLFVFKVIGALATIFLTTVYNLQRSQRGLNFRKLRSPNFLANLVLAEIGFKYARILVLRILNEVEMKMKIGEDLAHLHYFKGLIMNNERPTHKMGSIHESQSDPAIKIVENLKKYIMTGKREIE